MFAPPKDPDVEFYDEAHPFGGPLYSQGAFESWYDSYDPNALVDDDDPSQGRYRDIIPSVCQNDPATLARLANVDAGNPDPFDLFNPYCVTSISRE